MAEAIKTFQCEINGNIGLTIVVPNKKAYTISRFKASGSTDSAAAEQQVIPPVAYNSSRHCRPLTRPTGKGPLRPGIVSAPKTDTRAAEQHHDAASVVAHLEAAGRTLMAMRLRHPGPSEQTTAFPEVLREAIEAYGWTGEVTRAPMPSSRDITAMDATLAWIGLIPLDRYVLRRIVGARCLMHPIRDKNLFSWKRLALTLGADERAVQRWHGQGIDLIVIALREAKVLI